MIRLIPGARATSFPYEIDAMFRCRAQVFSERLGWKVSVKNGYERDLFDDENPLYVVSVDSISGQYCGSLRLLPTTGPNMLRDVFPCLLKDGEVIESATIWEASRICVLPAAGQSERGTCGTNYVLAELLAGVANVANLTGLTQIVAVFDARILRVLKAVGCNPQIVGTPRRIGDTMSFAGLFEMREAFRLAVHAGLGIDGSILSPGAKELAFQ
jgi:acyl homoserine lactone synthase